MPRKRGSPTLGRPPIELIKLRKPPEHVVDRVIEWLQEKHNSPRRPTVMGPLLTLIVYLDREGIPFPTREQLAGFLKTTKDAIDSARYTALARQEIAEAYEWIESPRRTRTSGIIRMTYVKPSRELVNVVASAERVTHTHDAAYGGRKRA
jgi:hypothetical protein